MQVGSDRTGANDGWREGGKTNRAGGREEGTMDEENSSHLVRPTVGTLGGEWRDERFGRGARKRGRNK